MLAGAFGWNRGILGTHPRVSGDFSVVIYHGSTSIPLLKVSIFYKLILFFFVFASYNAPNVMFYCFNVKHVHNLRTRIPNDLADPLFIKLIQHFYFFSLAIQHCFNKNVVRKAFFMYIECKLFFFSLKLRICFCY